MDPVHADPDQIPRSHPVILEVERKIFTRVELDIVTEFLILDNEVWFVEETAEQTSLGDVKILESSF